MRSAATPALIELKTIRDPSGDQMPEVVVAGIERQPRGDITCDINRPDVAVLRAAGRQRHHEALFVGRQRNIGAPGNVANRADYFARSIAPGELTAQRPAARMSQRAARAQREGGIPASFGASLFEEPGMDHPRKSESASNGCAINVPSR